MNEQPVPVERLSYLPSQSVGWTVVVRAATIAGIVYSAIDLSVEILSIIHNATYFESHYSLRHSIEIAIRMILMIGVMICAIRCLLGRVCGRRHFVVFLTCSVLFLCYETTTSFYDVLIDDPFGQSAIFWTWMLLREARFWVLPVLLIWLMTRKQTIEAFR